eukprot:1653739-Amphidinium_carterae.1
MSASLLRWDVCVDRRVVLLKAGVRLWKLVTTTDLVLDWSSSIAGLVVYEQSKTDLHVDRWCICWGRVNGGGRSPREVTMRVETMHTYIHTYIHTHIHTQSHI